MGRRRREVECQSPVLSQAERAQPPLSHRSPPIVKWMLGPGAGPPPPALIFAASSSSRTVPGQSQLVQNGAEKLWG